MTKRHAEIESYLNGRHTIDPRLLGDTLIAAPAYVLWQEDPRKGWQAQGSADSLAEVRQLQAIRGGIVLRRGERPEEDSE